MAKDKHSVMESDSLTDDSQSQTLSDDGQSPSKNGDEKMSDERFKDILKRKDKAIEDLREQLEDTIADKEERLAELQEKEKLSASEKQEIVTLEDQILSIKRDPRSKAWLKVTEEIGESTSKKVNDQVMLEFTEDYIEELADKEKLSYEKMERLIIGYMKKIDPGASMNLLRRAKKAYKQMLEERSYEQKMNELKEKEKMFAETGGQTSPARQQTGKISVKDGLQNDGTLLSLLREIHDSQEQVRVE